MLQQPRMIALFVAAGLTLAAAPVPISNLLPTTDDVQALIDGKQYTDALGELRRLLDLKGEAAAPYNRHQLEMMRVECLLQMHNQDEALRTLITAQTEATRQSDMDEATAMITLIHRAPAYSYKPKAAGAKALNILDKEDRAAAFKSLWSEVEAKVTALAKADKKYGTMATLMDDAAEMATDHALEYMATGKAEETDKLSKALHDKAVKLLNNEITQMNSAVQAATRHANTVITQTMAGGGTRTYKTGLSRNDIQSLEGVESTGKLFPPNMVKLAQYFPSDAKTFADFSARAVAIAERASQAEHASY